MIVPTTKTKTKRPIPALFSQCMQFYSREICINLKCYSSLCGPTNIKVWINAAAERGVENFDLSLPDERGLEWMSGRKMSLPSAILSSRTLVVLKLMGLTVKADLPVHLPSLKILHLYRILFKKSRDLAKFLSGCPVLEYLKEYQLDFYDSLCVGEFKCLPKLVRAYIHRLHVPLESVSNVEFLRIEGMSELDNMNPSFNFKDLIPMFPNLTHIELVYFFYISDWLEVVEMLNRCPKLQILVINLGVRDVFKEYEEDWQYPQFVPESISLHLKTCRLYHYQGSEADANGGKAVKAEDKSITNFQ
ncbi:putative FBD-associated F-box protein At5g56700 [Gastrolobium bilobum]|uniref:putative FBD-associated F-box protein At5g56700 n=1 Tax=Gastrolobium bilobum TaxID=150636 RepID=UPI002AB2D208|nr:putative FBD-associated F-box protein At5g56700 [Gastrolobium bilobum]